MGLFGCMSCLCAEFLSFRGRKSSFSRMYEAHRRHEVTWVLDIGLGLHRGLWLHFNPPSAVVCMQSAGHRLFPRGVGGLPFALPISNVGYAFCVASQEHCTLCI